MLTIRGWSFLLLNLSLLALGLLAGQRAQWTLTTLGITLLIWFLGEWLLFTLRVKLAVTALRTRRQVRDDRGVVDTLWAGRSFRVGVEVHLNHWLSLPYVRIDDQLPFGVEATGRSTEEGELSSQCPLTLRYKIRPQGAGRVRFEGVRVQLADYQGFFHLGSFIHGPINYRVLPPLTDVRGKQPTVKRYNLLPSPGLHRYLRPGSGSELLDLRDYLAGDPPKTIAWKVSARRDRLITKEFESEVPVRCTLFVDAGHSVRLGPVGRTGLARIVEVSAAVAQANAGTRDLTGLCIFDDQRLNCEIRPSRGTGHLIEILHRLADAAGLAPATRTVHLRTLLPLAYSLAQEVYPEWLRPQVNRLPPTLAWFWPPAALLRGRGKRLIRGLLAALAISPLFLAALLVYWQSDNLLPFIVLFLDLPKWLLVAAGLGLLTSCTVISYAFSRSLDRLASQLVSSRRRRLARWRKPLAALLSVRYGLEPGGLGVLLEDDEMMGLHLQRFLAEHHVPYPVPFYDSSGRYLFASPGKVDVLAEALMRSVGRGRDNELFVLLVDLLELGEALERLVKAVKVTLARHHQVLLICPWPPGVPVPHASPAIDQDRSDGIQDLVEKTTVARFHEAFAGLRHRLARIGVPVVCAAEGDPVQLILDRLNRMRALGLGRRR